MVCERGVSPPVQGTEAKVYDATEINKLMFILYHILYTYIHTYIHTYITYIHT